MALRRIHGQPIDATAAPLAAPPKAADSAKKRVDAYLAMLPGEGLSKEEDALLTALQVLLENGSRSLDEVGSDAACSAAQHAQPLACHASAQGCCQRFRVG
jgi:hypothetical protein